MASDQIQPKLTSLLAKLHQKAYLSDLLFADFVGRSAYYFAELNYIHPFREGNGRSTREFMRQLFLKNGYEVNWQAVLTEQLLQAMEASVYDTAMLQRVLSQCLQRTESAKRVSN